MPTVRKKTDRSKEPLDIIPAREGEILPPGDASGLLKEAKGQGRVLAESITHALRTQTFDAARGRTATKSELYARMLVELALFQKTETPEGQVIVLQDPKEWLSLLKWIGQHLDGPVQQGASFSGVNIFKVYAGVDLDRL